MICMTLMGKKESGRWIANCVPKTAALPDAGHGLRRTVEAERRDREKLLGRFGPVEHIRGMETPYHYRNKVVSTFTTGWGGKLTSGIYAANSHKVLPVESCLLQDEVLDKTMLAVRAAAGACHYQPFNEDKGTGLLRHCLLRRGVMTGQVMVVLVTAQPVLPGAKNLSKPC
mgnify:FL=1